MSTLNNEKGGISVQTEHIFPVIKKWLYSEKEIFLREIVSNAVDAVTKVKRLVSLGQASCGENEEYRVDVRLDADAQTITVSDNGIGMNADELRKYICEIALSGALDFIEKYEGESENSGNGIIGHFGLGFYSAFMVSSSVEVITRSIDGSDTVRWVCDEAGSYEISYPETARDRGTDVIMHVSDDGKEYLSADKLTGILNKYCAFMPVAIYFTDAGKAGKDDSGDSEAEDKDAGEKPVNDTNPLWMRNPSDCTEDEYKEFYTRVFSDYREPLFHIHINADYPLNFKGILFFPKIMNDYEPLEGQVKLYYNQVFVADNIKEVIPEFLLTLRGVIDCPELPLNVSRSYLQNSGYVKKISSHIVKKVADKLNSLYGTERENYEKIWKDIKLFVEYGSIKDAKFHDRVKNSVLYELTDGSFVTLDEYKEQAKGKNDGTVYYCTDPVAQSPFLSLFEKEGIKVVVMQKILDTEYMQKVESDSDVKFRRVDSGIDDSLKGEGEVLENKELAETFVRVSGNDKLKVEFAALKDTSTPAILNVPEEQRRFTDMMKAYGSAMPDSNEMTLILNSSNPLITKLASAKQSEARDAAAKQLYTLALMSFRTLTASELRDFLAGSYGIIGKSLEGDMPADSDTAENQ